jgi:hypothetical protein
MKKPFLSLLFFFITLISFAQGIAVQGIARDNVNSAISNKTLVFTFFIVNDDNTKIFEEVQSINTDNFGVFSHVIGTGTAEGDTFDTVDFSIENLKLKVVVNHGGTNIDVYEQPFQYTPYAHFAKYAASAANGVPTGAIMPFMGGKDNVPEGWLLCDGSPIPDGPLKDMLTSNNVEFAKTPDLRGMFLRGTGHHKGEDNFVGADLGKSQLDAIRSHVLTVTDDEHAHPITDKKHLHDIAVSLNDDIGGIPYGGQGVRGFSENMTSEAFTGITGTNSASSNISVKYIGANETRSVNYGVNYIIKL